MEKLGKIIAFTAFLAVLVGIGMIAVQGQGQGKLKTRDFDLPHLVKTKKVQIDKLRDLVKGDLTHEYMLKDAFLLKWLLDQDFVVKQAAEKLKQNLAWRAEQKMDSILDENWEELKTMFPYSRNTTDKFGRPLIYFNFGEWNVAKFFSEQQSGKSHFERYFNMLWEEAEEGVRDLQAEGKNVTQSIVIINVGNFSLEKQGCLQCLHAYRNIGETLSSNFPWACERNLFVNVPYLFEVVNSYLIDRNQRNMNKFGSDKSVWEQRILETVDENQIPEELRLELGSQSVLHGEMGKIN